MEIVQEKISREKLFEDLTDLIMTLKVHPKHIQGTASIIKKWQNKRERVFAAINNLSNDDKKWIDNQYRIWFEKNVTL